MRGIKSLFVSVSSIISFPRSYAHFKVRAFRPHQLALYKPIHTVFVMYGCAFFLLPSGSEIGRRSLLDSQKLHAIKPSVGRHYELFVRVLWR